MTQKFTEDGNAVPVTIVTVGPCVILDKKEYSEHKSIQIAFDLVDSKKVNKPLRGFFKKVLGKDENYRTVKEFKMSKNDVMFDKLESGQVLNASIFNVGDILSVQGRSKGKGFQGVVKRHGFKGSPASHGHKDQLRMPGSAGATGPAHVFKGTRMGGHMGDEMATIKKLEIIDIDLENNEIWIKGAVPGHKDSLLFIMAEGDFEIPKIEEEKVNMPVVEAESENKEEVKNEEIVESSVTKVSENENEVKKVNEEENKQEKKEEAKE